jgi:hypothetical protein
LQFAGDLRRQASQEAARQGGFQLLIGHVYDLKAVLAAAPADAVKPGEDDLHRQRDVASLSMNLRLLVTGETPRTCWPWVIPDSASGSLLILRRSSESVSRLARLSLDCPGKHRTQAAANARCKARRLT